MPHGLQKKKVFIFLDIRFNILKFCIIKLVSGSSSFKNPGYKSRYQFLEYDSNMFSVRV